MRLHVSFGVLDSARKRMGADLIGVTVNWATQDPIALIQLELEQGKEVELSDVSVNTGSLLTYKNQHVILYIRDQKRAAEGLLRGKGNGYRFHVADCRKLKEMRLENRFERYVVTNHNTGQFLVRGKDAMGNDIEGHARIPVCQFCLDTLNYKGARNADWSDRRAIVATFDLGDFFRTYSSYFDALPKRNADDIEREYGPDWQKISRRYRDSVGWLCERCGVQLATNKDLLHVHHVNRNPSDNRRSNLNALCAVCHSKEAGHEAMYVSHGHKRRIAHLRSEQSVSVIRAQSSADASAWEKVGDLADGACSGLVELLQRWGVNQRVRGRQECGAPPGVPEVGWELMENGEVKAMAELAWESGKVAIVLREGEDANALRTRGWEVVTIGDAMTNWFPSR